ncbi:MAG: hypothetical protein LBL07_18610, partial [Tannerella sp.]|nr:hypothetical protein [Tannerella sp.]
IGERSGKRRIIPREEQLKTIRRKIELAQKFERAIAEEREDAFVYGELKEEIQRIVNARFKEKGNTFKEWMIDSITETFADQTKRGYAPLSFNYCIAKQMNKLYGEYKNRPGTVQVNERIM